jgi:hypothetical protein
VERIAIEMKVIARKNFLTVDEDFMMIQVCHNS